MSPFARYTMLLSFFSAIIEVILALAIGRAWSPGGVQEIFLVFLAGPPIFLALIAWRRCTHADRSRFLFVLALIVELPALAILLYDYIQFRSEPAGEHATHSHPLIIPLVQWIVILVIWIVLAVREGREKRAKQAAEKTAEKTT
jgi:hypothetical protein